MAPAPTFGDALGPAAYINDNSRNLSMQAYKLAILNL